MRSEWRSPQGHTRAFTRMAAPLPTAACQPPSCQWTALPCRGPLGARGQVSACVQSPGGSTCRKRCSGQGAEPRPARRLARLESATSLRDADGPTRPAWAFCQGPSHTQVYAQAQPANAHCTPTRTRNPPPHRRTPRSHGHTLQGVCASGCARGWSRLGPRARTFEQASYTEPGAPNEPNEGEAGDSLADFLP